MIEGGAKGDDALHYSSNRVPANPRGTLKLGRPFRVVPSHIATLIRHWIWAVPERRCNLGRSSILQPRQSIKKADT